MVPTGDRRGVCSQLTLDCRRGWWEPLRVDGSLQAQTFRSSLASSLPIPPGTPGRKSHPGVWKDSNGRRNGRRQFLRPHLFPLWQEVSSSPQSGAPSGWSRKPVSTPDHPWNTRPCICTDVGRTRTPSSLATERRWSKQHQRRVNPLLPATGPGLTPRELLERRLEWGEPLRSRDTCFRTSAATVLGRQKRRMRTRKLGNGGWDYL